MLLYGLFKFRINQRQQLDKRVSEQTVEITHQKEKLEELARFKESFYRRMAHELRTPMPLIQTSLELISNNLEKSDANKIRPH